MTDSREHAETIQKAVLLAVDGNWSPALDTIQPLLDEGPRSAFALCAALAEAATYKARRDRPANHMMFRPKVINEATGEEGPMDEVPPAVLFVAQFSAAWANRDQDGALALFNAFTECAMENDHSDIAKAVGILFRMAVLTTAELRPEQGQSTSPAELIVAACRTRTQPHRARKEARTREIGPFTAGVILGSDPDGEYDPETDETAE